MNPVEWEAYLKKVAREELEWEIDAMSSRTPDSPKPVSPLWREKIRLGVFDPDHEPDSEEWENDKAMKEKFSLGSKELKEVLSDNRKLKNIAAMF